MLDVVKVPVAARLLRVWRRADGRNQGQCAQVLGIRQPTWSDYESGKKTPRTQVALALAALTNDAVPVLAWGKFETEEEAAALEAEAIAAVEDPASEGLLPANPDEVTPAEAPAPKRLSSRPPPPEQLADAADVDEKTMESELPSSTPKNLPPVKVSERNDRTDTNPDPNAGDVLPPVKRRLTVLDRDTPVPESD